MLHLAEQVTDFSCIKYTASDQSLVWSIAESCLTFQEATSPGIQAQRITAGAKYTSDHASDQPIT